MDSARSFILEKDIGYSQSAVKICQIIQRIKNRTEKAFGGIVLSVKGKRLINTIYIQENWFISTDAGGTAA